MILKINNTEEWNKKKKIQIKNNSMIIQCKECPHFKENFYKNKCISCISFNLFKNKKKNISNIILKSYNYTLNYKKLLLFLDYNSHLKEINGVLEKIKNLRRKCIYSDFQCKILDNAILNLNEKIDLYNPILFYKIIKSHYSKLTDIQSEYVCQQCIKKINLNITYLLKITDSIEIIQNFKNFTNKRNLFKQYSNFYEFLLSNLISYPKKISPSKLKAKKKNLIEKYSIGKDKIYDIFIYNIENEREKTYSLKTFFEKTSDEDFFQRIINFISNKIELIKSDKLISIEKLIESYQLMAIKEIDLKFDVNNLNKKRIGLLIALKIIKLEKIFPFLIDNNIEEIFLDSPLDKIYLNHHKYGRCRTKIRFDKKEIERIITMLRLYSGQRLDYSNPNLKMILKNKFFYCRFAIDIAPINFNEFSLDIRKLNKDIYNIQDLIKNNTLNPKMAAFLYFCILKRINFTVTGKTDSGKTTLINALDLLTPKEYRKIYIENVVESLDEIIFEKHQLKFKVDSLDNFKDKKTFTKSSLIKTLLHRTPDIIFLGEILTKEECEATFHCLSAGLKGFQTIHANSLKSLINRFLYHFNINKSCLNDLDLIILMRKKENFKRQIYSINEIFLNKENKIVSRSIFRFNPKLNKWELLIPLYETKIVKKICKYEYLSRDNFNTLLNLYRDIFQQLSIKDKLNNLKLIEFFHRLSFLSLTSINQLKEYYNDVGKNLF
jgi:Flp pilus assembly CpaF family ATPase